MSLHAIRSGRMPYIIKLFIVQESAHLLQRYSNAGQILNMAEKGVHLWC